MAQLGRSQPFRPHLAGPLVAAAAVNPVVATATVVNRVPKRSFERRGAPHAHLPGPIVAPGGPVVPGETFKATATTLRPARDWEARRHRPHLAKPLLFVPGFPIAPAVVVNQVAVKRAVERRGAPKPHTVTFVFTAPVGGNPMPSLVRTGLFPRGQWRVPQIHLPGSLVVFSTPVIAGKTVLLQSKQRVFVGRTVPKPHLISGIVAPGGVVIPTATILLVVNSKRTTQGRGGHLHLPPATLTQPAAVNPFAPAVFKGQHMRRPYVGRTTPAPHRASPNLTPSPFRPGTFTNYSTRRVHIGRTTPRPHVTGPVVIPFVVGPNPVGPGLFLSQAKQRMFVGRHVTQAVVATPLQAAPARPLFITFTALLGDYRWRVSVSNLRWSTESTAARWSSAIPQQRWVAGVTRYA